jgi:hypothetical protein
MANVPKLQYLPGIVVEKNDGGLAPEAGSPAPRVLILGTSAKGQGSSPYLVRNTSLAKGEFGLQGTLIRGMYEAKKAGAQEISLFRIGATAAVLEGLGGEASQGTGYTITTFMEDDTAGSVYGVYYDDNTDRLIVTDLELGTVVYDNDSTTPIDTDDVIVSGYRDNAQSAGYWDNVGTPSTPVALEDVVATAPSTSDYTYVAGTDGTSLSRMELYEKLYTAYKLLAEYQFDVIVPMDIYLDDYNLVDQGLGLALAKRAPVSDNGTNTYPTAGDYKPGLSLDGLGKVYVEEYLGSYYFWWKFSEPTSVNFTADIYPAGIGSASATLKIDGTSLSEEDYHEVNFAYQLARFLFEYSTNNVDATGVIGVRPPASAGLADIANWLGEEPTYTIDNTTGLLYIASAIDDGKGLLGNKFMAGKADYRSGEYGGGMIATDTEFMDGSEIIDDNDYPIDLGKYISICVDHPYLYNDYLQGGYRATYAPSYGGYYSVLAPNSAPTNKLAGPVRLYYKVGIRKLDLLSKHGYVSLRNKAQGVVIADAPTASLPGSDYKRLSTVRIVKDIIDAVRIALDPFIGEGTTDASKAAMHTAVDNVLLRAKQAGYLNAYKEFDIYQTADMRVQGKAEIALVLVPAFELREITVTISLAKE